MASRWLTEQPSDPSDHESSNQLSGEQEGHEDRAEQELRASIMRQVVVRSAGGGGKRSWRRLPIESEASRKAPKLTPAERAAQIATAAATAAASAAAAAAVAITAPKAAPPGSPSRGQRTDPAAPTSPATPVAAAPSRAQANSSTKQPPSQHQGPSPVGPPRLFGPRSDGAKSHGLHAESSSSLVRGPAPSSSAPPELPASGDSPLLVERPAPSDDEALFPPDGSDGARQASAGLPASGDGLVLVERPASSAGEALPVLPELRASGDGSVLVERPAPSDGAEVPAPGNGEGEPFAFSDAESSNSKEDRRLWAELFSENDEHPEEAGSCDELGGEEAGSNPEAAGAAGEEPEHPPQPAQRRSGNDELQAAGAPKGQGKAKGKGKGKAKAKAKAEAEAKAKPATKGSAKAKAKAAPKAKAEAKGKAKGKAKAKAAPGTAGTFAGRRPPASAQKRAHFDEMKAHYLQARLEAVETKEEASGSSSSTSTQKTKRKFSPNQEKYWAAMQKRMSELARAGVPGAERMRIAAADWKASLPDE